MTGKEIYVGIDVSKSQLDVAVRPLGSSGRQLTTGKASAGW